MSLGNDADVGGVERFSTICSVCKKETTVPFKPEPGRPVYCKDCIAKLKAGEIKPIKGSINQIKYDESKFFKPLSDLGIEFEQKSSVSKGSFEEQRSVLSHSHDEQVRTRPGIFSAIKKVFNKNSVKPPQPWQKNNVNPIKNQFRNNIPKERPKENLALKEILNKTLNENKILETKKQEIKEEVKEEIVPSISLNELKTQIPSSQLKDKSASQDDMNKLKNLIKESAKKTEIPEIPLPARNAGSIATAGVENKAKIPIEEKKEEKLKEVPEDVLRKILE
jgi:CxxC-x17-CxxC domain-containing protein